MGYQTFFLVVSNLIFLLDTFKALKLRRYTRAFLYLSIVFVSSFYHLCKEDWEDKPGKGGYCVVLSFAEYHFFDFFYAQLILPLSSLYLIPFGEIKVLVRKERRTRLDSFVSKIVYEEEGRGEEQREEGDVVVLRRSIDWIERWLIYTYASVLVVSMLISPPGVVSFLSLIASSLMITVFFWIYTYKIYGARPRFDTKDLLVAVFIILVAMSLIVVQNFVDHEFYWIIHSVWHVLGGLGQFFLLESRDYSRNGLRTFWPKRRKEDHGVHSSKPHRAYDRRGLYGPSVPRDYLVYDPWVVQGTESFWDIFG